MKRARKEADIFKGFFPLFLYYLPLHLTAVLLFPV